MWVPSLRLLLSSSTTKLPLRKLNYPLTRCLSTSSAASMPHYTFSDSSSETRCLSSRTASGLSDNSQVLNYLNCLREQPIKAFNYFTQLKQNGSLFYDVDVYALVVRICCVWRLEKQVNFVFFDVFRDPRFRVFELLERIRDTAGDREREVLVTAIKSVIKVYVNAGMFGEAVDVFIGLGRRGFVPSVLTCNFLMDRLVEFGEVSMALGVYNEMLRIGVRRNDHAYAIGIKVFCRNGDFDGALGVFQEMEDGIEPCSVVYKTYIEELCRNRMTDFGYQVLQAWRKSRVPLDAYAYTVVIHGYINEAKLEHAERVLYEMVERRFLPHVYCYGALIRGYCKMRNAERALAIHDYMVSKGVETNCRIIEELCRNRMTDSGYQVLQAWIKTNVQFDAYAYTIVIHGFIDETKLEEAECVLYEMEERRVCPDIYSYGALISGYCKMRKLERALAIHDYMVSKGVETNCVIISSIIQCLCEMGMASEAAEQFVKFRKLGVSLDKVAYNIVINGLCKIGKVEEAIEFIKDMKGQQMTLDVIHYTTLINGYCLQGNVADAIKTFKEMKESGLRPDIVAYNVLAGGLARNGLVKETMNLLKNMKSQGFNPHSVTQNAIIEGFCIAGKVKEAEAFFYSLEDKSVEDKSVHKMYNRLIAAFCEAGEMISAKRIFYNLVKRGLSPDVITYTIMMNSYCKNNCIQQALDLFYHMIAAGIKPDVVTYTVLLDGLPKTNCKNSSVPVRSQINNNIANVSTLWSQMEDMNIKPDVICYTVLIDRHCEINNVEDAMGLLDEMVDRGIQPDTVTYTALLSGCFKRGDFVGAKTIDSDMKIKGVHRDEWYQSVLDCGSVKAKKVQFRR